MLEEINYHSQPFIKIYNDLHYGQYVKPRGELIIELENYSYELNPYVRFQNFESRKLNIDYIKKEFLWYLEGNRFDLTICDHAKIWSGIINTDGSINSNYGQYLFNDINQFDNVINTLKLDKDSRRASMTILDSKHLKSNTKDVPCTYALNFRIRNNLLNMTVHMRSQDAIYGMGNDAPAFSFIHEMMLNALKEYYPELQYGNYHHFVDSFHVYERHFKMLDKLRNGDSYDIIKCPKISGPDEVKFLKNQSYKTMEPLSKFEFTKWLIG
jgi:thymidylate synthase